jgi:demethylmacrocin O-methyltransferase
MWRDYFKNGKVYGLDIYKKEINLGNRVKIFQGSQDDAKILSKIIKQSGKLDYIVDDGSHLYKDVVFSFNYLFNHLKNGGLYFIEDIQTSYLREFGGDGFYLQNKKTIINYFKGIIDKINHKEIENPFYKIDEIAKNVTEVHFYHNLIVIKLKNVSKILVLPHPLRLSVIDFDTSRYSTSFIVFVRQLMNLIKESKFHS